MLLSHSDQPVESKAAITAWRFRFVAHNGEVRGDESRHFTHPHSVTVVRQALPVGDGLDVGPEPLDWLDVICVSVPSALPPNLKGWLNPPADPSAVTTVGVQTETVKLRWRPGRAIVFGSTHDCDKAIAGLVEFAFLEGELRRLEQAITPHQATAERDVDFAYDIRSRDRSQWARLYRTIQALYTLRLQFARLEPQLLQASRTLPAEARHLIARLSAKADIEARLESLSDQLEACEDLYEGATDRISDFCNYRKELWLEIAIVILLLVEVVLLLRH